MTSGMVFEMCEGNGDVWEHPPAKMQLLGPNKGNVIGWWYVCPFPLCTISRCVLTIPAKEAEDSLP